MGTFNESDEGKLFDLTEKNVNIEYIVEYERKEKYVRRASRSNSTLSRDNLARLQNDAPPAYEQHSFCNGNNETNTRRNRSADRNQKNEFARSSTEEYPRYENNREYQKYGTDEKMPLCGRNEFSRCRSAEYPKYSNDKEYHKYSDDEKRAKSGKSEFEHCQNEEPPKYSDNKEYQKYSVDEKRLRFEDEFQNCRKGEYPKYENDKEYRKYDVDERPPLCGRSKSQEYTRYHSTKEYEKSSKGEKSPRSSKDEFERCRTADYPKYQNDKEYQKYEEEDKDSEKWLSDDDMDNASTIASVAWWDEETEEEAPDPKPKYSSRRHRSPRYSSTSLVSSLAPTESVLSSNHGSHKGYRKRRRRRRTHSRTVSKS